MSEPSRTIRRRVTWRSALLHVVLQPIYWTAQWVHQLAGNHAERRNRLWEQRLNYRLFLQGIPALLGAVLATAAAGMSWRATQYRVDVYANAAREAFEADDLDAAALYYERLTALRPDVDRFRYNLGLVYGRLGNRDRAAALIAPLAPPDRPGYAPAQLWLALQTLTAQSPADVEQLQAAEARLLRLRNEAGATGESADEGLTEIYARLGRIDDIRNDPRLLAAAERRPDLRLLLALAAAHGGNLDEARATARELVPLFRRRLDDFPDDDDARRRLSQAYGLLGEEAALIALLKQGAIVCPTGTFGPQLAEVLVARAVRLAQSPTADKSEKAAARKEALAVLDRYGSEQPRFQLIAGQLLRLVGDSDEAERRYLSVVDELPAARLELADLYAQLDRTDDAQRQYEALLDEHRRAVDAGRTTTDLEIAQAAVAARRLKRFDDAEQLLTSAPQTPELTAALIGLYAAWYDDLAGRPPQAEHLDVLRRGLERDAWSAPLLARLLAASRGDDERGTAAQSMLRRMIAVGDVPARAYLLLGTDAHERGDFETAERYLTRAQQLDPQSPVVLNNLAWTLMSAERPDLTTALSTADAAVSLAPSNPRFRDTRFRILAKLGRWEDARDDLERAAPVMAGKPDFHLAAAEVYEHLDLPELAAEHRRLVGEN